MAPDSESGFSRREVLATAGGAAAIAGLAHGAVLAQEAPKGKIAWRGPSAGKVRLKINGTERTVNVEPRTTLLDALRDHLDLTGSKRVCDRGACGACTVWIEGRPQNACLLLAIEVEGVPITTIEGLGTPERLHPVQEAFCQEDALQCGFCTPGMVMSCVALLKSNPKPSSQETREAIAGNLCRCGTYPNVLSAVERVARGGK
ncbi:MAG: (2Fe-2S)-binding protein [Planctomycetes bacterium]|nr:(2Fe-2S)-binding protein [Planctomycetota bacterium]